MIFGLQLDFINRLMRENFTNDKELYLGLGLSQVGAQATMSDFNEPDDLYGDETGYARSRIIFGNPVNGICRNENEIVFPTAEEDWTRDGTTITAVGIFKRYPASETPESGAQTQDTWELLCVLPFVPQETVLKGETAILNPNAIRLQITNK